MNIYATVVTGLLSVLIFSQQLYAEPYRGPAEVLSGETLRVDGKTFRLKGIDAPEHGQICINKSGKPFDCGRISATGMMDLTAGEIVACDPVSSILISPITATCWAGEYDLSEGMVYTGWALADPQSGAVLKLLQTVAESKKNGLWAGQFDLPWIWRESHPSITSQ